jgi:hypothetical protein
VHCVSEQAGFTKKKRSNKTRLQITKAVRRKPQAAKKSRFAAAKKKQLLATCGANLAKPRAHHRS